MNKTQEQTQGQLQQIVEPLLIWFAQNARELPWRENRDPYRVWVSEIMLQQTRVEAVKGYYTRFLTALPTVQDLAHAPEEQLMKLWQGLGYYNRARNLQKAAKQVVERHGGIFPQEYAQILALPGIGAYTAGALASICFEQPRPAVDGNVLRVLTRLLADSRCVDDSALKQEFTSNLAAAYPHGRCGAFTQALMELGALVCLPNTAPHCPACPLAELCSANKSGTQRCFPVKREKRPRKEETLTVFVLRCDGMLALCKREQPGVLQGLWELPNIPYALSETQALTQAAAYGVSPRELLRRTHKTHIFTHIHWDMICYFLECGQKADCFHWADAQELETNIALPTAFKKILDG